jgi:hypothetical protein
VRVIFSRTYSYSPAMEELMRTLTYSQMVSLDGYVEGSNGELDWAVVDEELHTHFEDSNNFTSTSLSDIFDVDGNVTQTTCPTETGQRLTFD